MKNFALLDENNKVINISIASDDWVAESWIEYTLDNPAIIGGDFVAGYFYIPQPYPSWTRFNGNWIAPIPMPTNGNYVWDESQGAWVIAD